MNEIQIAEIILFLIGQGILVGTFIGVMARALRRIFFRR